MRRAWAVLLVLGASLFSPGCRPPGGNAPDTPVAWTIAPDPPSVGAATFSFTLTESATGRRVQGARVRIEADMSHPGMAPVFATAREIAPGRYQAPLRLTMAGDWMLLIDAELRDGRSLHRQVDLPGVRER